MFEDILEGNKEDGIKIEPGVYLTLSCEACGKCDTLKVTKDWNIKTRWICEKCIKEVI